MIGPSSILTILQNTVTAVNGLAAALQKKVNNSFISVRDFGAVGDGSTDDTAAIVSAMTFANNNAKAVFFPDGIYLTAPIVIPTTLPRIFGESLSAIIKLKRQTYAANAPLIQCLNNGVTFQIDTLSIDVNDPSFNSTFTFLAFGSNFLQIKNISIIGSGNGCIRIRGGNNILVRDVVVFGTNGGFLSCVFCDNNNGAISRMRVEDCMFYGVHTFGAQLTKGDGLLIHNCRNSGNTGAGFAFGLQGSTYSEIRGCYSVDSSHEAFQLTDCYYSSIIGNHAAWGSLGADFGISINGTAALARFNKIVGNTIINSFSAGIALADWAQDTLIADNVLRDCGSRGTGASGTGGQIVQMVAYTATAGAINNNNQFINNTSITETGITTFGVEEINSGGGGSSVDNNIFKDNFIAGVTTLFTIVGLNSKFYDLNWQNYTPTLTPGGGTITSFTVNSASYLLRGKGVEIQFDITITNAGTGTGALGVSLPLTAVANGGSMSGREVAVTGKGVDGACNGTIVILFLSDNSSPVVTNYRVVASGAYKTP